MQNDKQDKVTQDELPEWYHQWRDEVDCWNYGRERPGNSPSPISALYAQVSATHW